MTFLSNRLLLLKCLQRQHFSISNISSLNLICVESRHVICCLYFSNTYCTAPPPRIHKFDTSKPYSYYEILGVPKNAKQSEIKQAYFRMAKVYHPDVSADEFARENFDKITEAYSTLIDLTQRYFYDRHGHTSEELKRKGTPTIFEWRPKYSIYEQNDAESKAVEDWFQAQGHVKTDQYITIRQRIKNAYVELRFGLAHYDFPWNWKSLFAGFLGWITFFICFYYALDYAMVNFSYRKPIPINLKWENDEIYDILWYAGARKSKPSSQSKGGMYHMPKVTNAKKSEYSHTIYSNTRSRTKTKNIKKYRQLQKELADARKKSWTEEKQAREDRRKTLRNDGFTV